MSDKRKDKRKVAVGGCHACRELHKSDMPKGCPLVYSTGFDIHSFTKHDATYIDDNCPLERDTDTTAVKAALEKLRGEASAAAKFGSRVPREEKYTAGARAATEYFVAIIDAELTALEGKEGK